MRASAKRGGRLPAARQEHARSEQCEGRGSPHYNRLSACYLNSRLTKLNSKLTVGCRMASTGGRKACWAVELEWPHGGPAPNALHSGPPQLKFIGVMQPEELVCSADSLPSKIYRSSRRAPRFLMEIL